MPKLGLLRTKMIQHSYTVSLCKNICTEAQFQTKCLVLIFYDFVWHNFARYVMFTHQLQNPWQMLAKPLCSMEPRLKITPLHQCNNIVETTQLTNDQMPEFHCQCECLNCPPLAPSYNTSLQSLTLISLSQPCRSVPVTSCLK